MIYLDNASTSFPKPEIVWERVDRFQRTMCANPGRGAYRLALESARVVMRTRELLAILFNIKDPSRIVFTQNCTEAINLALKGILKKGSHAVISSMEHNSVLRTLTHLKCQGIEFDTAHYSPEEGLKLSALEQLIKPETALIAAIHASNVTGDILPVSDIGKTARKRGILFIVDAAQSAGVLPIDVERDNIDILAFPGHKSLFGPQGTGGLYIREGIEIEPLRYGGTGSRSEDAYQPLSCPDRYESGTLNTLGIAGLGAGVQYILDRSVENIREYEVTLTEYLLESLSGIKGLKLYGETDPAKKTGIVSFNLEGTHPSEVAHVLDRAFDIAVRSGLHCAPSAHKAIGSFPDGTVRVSLSIFNTKEDIDSLADVLLEISKEIALFQN